MTDDNRVLQTRAYNNYYKNNKEAILKRVRIYRQNNKEKLAKERRIWTKKNRDKINERVRRRYWENKEAVRIFKENLKNQSKQ